MQFLHCSRAIAAGDLPHKIARDESLSSNGRPRPALNGISWLILTISPMVQGNFTRHLPRIDQCRGVEPDDVHLWEMLAIFPLSLPVYRKNLVAFDF